MIIIYIYIYIIYNIIIYNIYIYINIKTTHKFLYRLMPAFCQGAEVLQSAKLYGSLKAALTGTGRH